MGLNDAVDWGPIGGHIEAVVPRIEELPRDWLLFKTVRKSAPRPWLSGTMMLVNLQFELQAEHEAFLQMDDPMVDAYQTLSKPLLLLSEYTCENYTLGCGWAVTESAAGSRSSELSPSRESVLRRTRFMEFLDDKGMANMIQTYDCDGGMIAFGWTRELDGRRNAQEHGIINKETGHVMIVNRELDTRNCEGCEILRRTCTCDSREIELACESNRLIRREYARRDYRTATMGTKYYTSWMIGSWTSTPASIPLPPYYYDFDATDESLGFSRVLSFVIQEEIQKIQSPRQSQIFLSYTEPPQVSNRFISSLLSTTKSVEEWSTIAALQGEEIGTNVALGEHQKQGETTNDEGSRISGLNYPGTVKIARQPPKSKRQEIVRGGQAISIIPADGTGGGEQGEHDGMARFEGMQSALPESDTQQQEGEPPSTAIDDNTPKTSKRHSCPKCSMTFRRRYDMKRHVRTVHDQRRDYLCKECGKGFSQSGHLNEHVKVMHERVSSYMCQICKKAFGAQGKLDIHVQSVHENLRNYKCTLCEKSFKDPSSLRHHVTAVHSESSSVPGPSTRGS